MSLVINSNIAALNSQRQLATSSRALDTAMERLSSGRRINSAADDAAGLVLSNRMTSQIRGLGQAVSNANDGISLIQTTEGALDESTSILQRIRELSIQSANGIYGDADRATLDAEVQQLVSELDRISDTTSFNGKNVLDGSQSSVSLQVGADAYQTIEFAIPAMDTKSLGFSSTSGDIVGAELNLDLNGLLSNSLDAASIKINDQVLAGVADGASLQALLGAVNELSGVTATSYLAVEAENTGTGILQGGDAITITGIAADGTSQVYSFSNTASLDELLTDINTIAGDNLSASLSDSGRLVLSSERWAKVSIADTTGGIATGFDVALIADADIAATIFGLNNYWISESETLISTHFGIVGDGVDLTLNLDDSDGVGGKLASVSWLGPGLGTSLKLNIDMADFTDDNQPNGGTAPFYNDRIIAHEMVHAVMTRITDMSALPGWFTEGAAELIHGADERVLGDFASLDATDGSELLAAFKTTAGSPTTSAGYSASYLATKLLHDDIVAGGNADGIKNLFNRLELGESLSVALGHASVKGTNAWSDLADFEAHFLAEGVDYLNEVYVGGTLDLANADTGSIAGSDYLNPALNAVDVLANVSGLGAQNFNLVIPDEYAGTAKTASARLVLSSESGGDISIAAAANGSDSDLENLGFRDMSVVGEVVGEPLSSAEQSNILLVGDLIINGVSVAAVAADEGLVAKVGAINSVKAETGVVASIQAQTSLVVNTEGSVENTTTSAITSIVTGGVLGLNGIGMLVNVGDSAYDIAASINAVNFAHGVTAYVDDSDLLHMQSERAITISASTGGLAAALAFTASAATGPGSININGVELTLSDLGSVQDLMNDINSQRGFTGVGARIDDNGQLSLQSSASIRLALGNTNGLQSLQTLGISFGTDAGLFGGQENLRDTDGDNLLGDEIFTLDARIKLNSVDKQIFSLELTSGGVAATGLSDLNASSAGLSGASLDSLSVGTQRSAQEAIEIVDNALETIDITRSELGAVNNRLEFTVSNLMNIAENTSSARSRITDADFAAESARLSRAQVLQQAAQAMLAQANSQPQQIMQLLQ